LLAENVNADSLVGRIPLSRCIPLRNLHRNSVVTSFQYATVNLKPIVESTHVLAINNSTSFRLEKNLNGNGSEFSLSESLLSETLTLLGN